MAYFSYSNTEKSNQKMQVCLIQLSANNEQLQQPQWINTVDTAKFMPAITAGSKHGLSWDHVYWRCFLFVSCFNLRTVWKLFKITQQNKIFFVSTTANIQFPEQ